jgi:hypothetical protein
MNSYSERHDKADFGKRFWKGLWMAIGAGLIIGACLFGMGLLTYLSRQQGW